MTTSTSEKRTSSQRPTRLSVAQDRNIATFAHFGGILGCIPSAVIYYLYHGRAPFAEQESKEALNFTLLPSILIVAAIGLSYLPGIGWIFGLIASLIWVYLAASSMIAGIQVNKSYPYQYRFNTMLFSILTRR